MKRKQSPLENYFKLLLQSEGITEYEREYKFHPKRKWRADFFFPKHNLIVEINGGIFMGRSGHLGAGYVKDMEKYRAINKMGISLFVYTKKEDMRAFPDDLKELIANRKN